jgi:hypothetical protein
VAEARRPAGKQKNKKHTPFGVCFLFGGEMQIMIRFQRVSKGFIFILVVSF